MLKQYETVFIATPVLSEQQMKEAVAKYTKLIADNGGEVVYEEDWGLRQLAYPIQHKTSGFYYLIQFKAEPSFIAISVMRGSSGSLPWLLTSTPRLTPRREGRTGTSLPLLRQRRLRLRLR